MSPESERAQMLFRHLIDKNVVAVSTLVLNERPSLPDDVEALLNESGLRGYKNYQINFKRLKGVASQAASQAAYTAMDIAFWRAGGHLAVGTDAAGTGVLPGYSNLRAIELFVEAGIPPLEAIKIATQNGATAMGIADDRGTIEVGKRADLIVFDGDPSVEIKDIYKIEMVFKKGIGYDPVALKKSAIGTIGGPG